MLAKKPQNRATIFISPTSQHAAGSHTGKLFFNPTVSDDFGAKEPGEDLCHGNIKGVHSIGSRGCTLVEHPGARVPLLDRSSEKYRRDYYGKASVDFRPNRELAEHLRTFRRPGAPALNHTGTSYGDAHASQDPNRLRGAQRETMRPVGKNDGLITGGDAPVVNTSFSHRAHTDPTGVLSRPKGEAWLPSNNLATVNRKPDFWVSSSQREFRTPVPSTVRSTRERAKDLDALLGGLRRDALARCRSAPGVSVPANAP